MEFDELVTVWFKPASTLIKQNQLATLNNFGRIMGRVGNARSKTHPNAG